MRLPSGMKRKRASCQAEDRSGRRKEFSTNRLGSGFLTSARVGREGRREKVGV